MAEWPEPRHTNTKGYKFVHEVDREEGDFDFEVNYLTKVVPPDNKYHQWEVCWDDGAICTGIDERLLPEGLVPEEGMTFRIWGRGLGYPIRGQALDGEVIYYMTAEEQEAEFRRQRSIYHENQRLEAEATKEERDARVRRLPMRLEHFIYDLRNSNPDFEAQDEPYQLFVYEEAVVIGNTLKTVDAINAWKNMEWTEQLKEVPALSDGHSNNTFAMAVAVAKEGINEGWLPWASTEWGVS